MPNPPPPPPPNLSIAFQPAPPTSVPIGTTAMLSATVTNDPNNYGVDWSLTCSMPGNCGSLSAPHTASGQAVSFAPPSNFTGNSVTVNIVAFATADHSFNVAAPIAVVAFASKLQGSFVFHAEGIDQSFTPYQVAGVVALDGNGGVTSVEQTANFFDLNTGAFTTKTDTVQSSAGSYFIGSDGRGTLTINTNDPDVASNGSETFSIVYLSSSQVLISQADFTESASGAMDLQTSTAAPAHGYAFVASGNDFNSGSSVAFGGVLNIDSANTISGAGSVADQNFAGTLTAKQGLSGTVSAPDSFGAFTLNLNIPGFQSTNTFQFTGYIVDDAHIKLIENDNASGAGLGSVAGVAIGQGSATGTFKSNSAFSGKYVFGILGVDLTGFTPATLTAAGLFSADGSGGLNNGYIDMLLEQNGNQGFAGSQISSAFKGNYSVDSSGSGRVHATFKGFSGAVQPPVAPNFFLYLTGNGNPPLMLDASDNTGDYPSVGSGIVYPQAAGPLTLNGQYGITFTQQDGQENDGSGQITIDTTTNTLSGVVDVNTGFNPIPSQTVTGTIQAPQANGLVVGTLTGQSSFFVSPFNVDYYIVDAGHGFFVETDLLTAPQPTVTFGFYATRNPVCTGCP